MIHEVLEEAALAGKKPKLMLLGRVKSGEFLLAVKGHPDFDKGATSGDINGVAFKLHDITPGLTLVCE